jgi:outer membrane efflux protein
MWAQSLSWTEALDRMQNHNQKLKGIEKQTEAATEGKKPIKGFTYHS